MSNSHAIACLAAMTFALASCSAPPAVPELPWTDLFDGQSLDGWQATNFGGEGEVLVEQGAMHLDLGSPMTGVTLTAEPPSGCYELELTAARVEGVDFFCGLTFPVGDTHLSLILGGWGGSVCGLSNLDGDDAAHNSTRKLQRFELGRDYIVKVIVHEDRVTVHLDGQPLCETSRVGQELSLRPEVTICRPLGIASFATRARIRGVRWRALRMP